MADIAASTLSGIRHNVTGNTRVVSGTIVTFDTAATAEDTVFCGLSRVRHVSVEWATTAATTVHTALRAFPSTVNAGGFVVKNLTTHANFPVTFRAEGL